MTPAVQQFLSQMQKRRQDQLAMIKNLGASGPNPGLGLNMPAAQTRPGLVGGIIHGITGLLGGNAAQAGLQSGLNSAVGALSSLFGANAAYGAVGDLAPSALGAASQVASAGGSSSILSLLA